MADKKKTRRWVIRAIVTFLAVMLLLTFFSNTIMNATIPKVVAEYAQWGNLSFTNSAKGTTVCSNQVDYKAPKSLEGRKIKEISTSDYENVAEGASVITLYEVEDQTAYDTLVEEYEDFKKIIYYDEKTPKTDSTKSYKDLLDSAKETVESANKSYAESKEKDSTIANAQSSLESKQAELTAVSAEIEAASATVEEYETTVASLKSQLERVEKKIEEVKAAPVATPTAEPTAAPTSDPATPSDPSTTSDPTTTDPTTTVPTTTEPSETEPSLPNTLEELELQKEDLEGQIADAEAVLEDAKSRLSSNSSKKAELDSDIAELQGTITSASQLLDEEDAKKALDKANKSYSDAQKDLSDAEVNAGITNEKNADAKAKNDKKIKDYEDKIKEMEESINTVEIKSPKTGVMTNIRANQDDVIHEGDVLFSVMPNWEDIECTVEFNFSTDESQSFYQGMELECDTHGIDKVVIISIKPDKASPRDRRVVKCQVFAETLYPGEEIVVIAGQSNKNYDNIVPSSAVITDNTGDFVYALVEKNTPLGTKYTVKKIEVEVEATDGARSAIKAKGDGKLDSKYQYVTRSEEPLKDGDRVRLQDYSKKE